MFKQRREQRRSRRFTSTLETLRGRVMPSTFGVVPGLLSQGENLAPAAPAKGKPAPPTPPIRIELENVLISHYS